MRATAASLADSLQLQSVLQHRVDDSYPGEAAIVVQQCRIAQGRQRLSAPAAALYERTMQPLVDVEVQCQATAARLRYMSQQLYTTLQMLGSDPEALPQTFRKTWDGQQQQLASAMEQAQAAIARISLLMPSPVCREDPVMQEDSSLVAAVTADASASRLDTSDAVAVQQGQPVELYEGQAQPPSVFEHKLSEAEELAAWKQAKTERARQRALQKTLAEERRLEGERTRRLLSELQSVIDANGGLRESKS